MDEVRLINAIPLEKEMLEYADYIGRETTNECESTAETCADMVSEAPTIDPESLRPTAKWIIVRRMADGAECKCGNCGRKEVFTTFDRHTDHVYCCRCGCKMEAAVEIEVRKNDDDAV